MKLTHINGDLYVLEPTDAAKSLLPNDSIVTQLRGEPWAINVSDAPSGFYLMPNREESDLSAAIPVAVRIGDFPAADKLRPGGDDRVPVVTAESRFIENESLQKLPADDVLQVTPTPLKFVSTAGEFRITDGTPVIYDSGLEAEAHSLEHALATF